MENTSSSQSTALTASTTTSAPSRPPVVKQPAAYSAGSRGGPAPSKNRCGKRGGRRCWWQTDTHWHAARCLVQRALLWTGRAMALLLPPVGRGHPNVAWTTAWAAASTCATAWHPSARSAGPAASSTACCASPGPGECQVLDYTTPRLLPATRWTSYMGSAISGIDIQHHNAAAATKQQ